MTTRHLTVARAAELLRRHPSTVRRWIRAGALRVVVGASGLRVPRSELARLLSAVSIHEHLRTPVDTAAEAHGYDRTNGDTTVEDPMIDVSQYLSLRDAAEKVNRSSRTVRRWVAQGDLPNALTLKGRLLIPPADLERLFHPRGRVEA